MRSKRCCHTWNWRPLLRPSLRQTRSKLHGPRRPARRPAATMNNKVLYASYTRYIHGVGMALDAPGTVDAAATLHAAQMHRFIHTQVGGAMADVATQLAAAAEVVVAVPAHQGAMAAAQEGPTRPRGAAAEGATTDACGKRYHFCDLHMVCFTYGTT